MVEPTEKVKQCCDPDDDRFLELAINGKAVCIVSGDDDLLVLLPFVACLCSRPGTF
ncbi:MAG: putative toxin-antitoxin system toxin component, PIN family [candidate division KSB1 bacterium]|nr:putative toxin-antitoxin system toxin component, PIN family [candidate division KSB1 bacterium]MDZ7311940.1 putative toxin-antitoxin system toxin component, PIN family [candidate division KSB1 bacterium]